MNLLPIDLLVQVLMANSQGHLILHTINVASNNIDLGVTMDQEIHVSQYKSDMKDLLNKNESFEDASGSFVVMAATVVGLNPLSQEKPIQVKFTKGGKPTWISSSKVTTDPVTEITVKEDV